MVHFPRRRVALDNMLRPEKLLSESMNNEEATRWLAIFDSYLSRNEEIIDRKSVKCVRALLESLLEANIIARLAVDTPVTEHTTIRGPSGVLNVLRGYFSGDSPTQSTQTQDADMTNEHHTDSTTTETTKLHTSSLTHPAWIFHAYLQQIDAEN